MKAERKSEGDALRIPLDTVEVDYYLHPTVERKLREMVAKHRGGE